MSIRRTITVLLVATAALAAAAVPVSAATGHGAMIARNHQRCLQHWDYDYHRSSHPEWTRVDLEPVLCGGWHVEAKAECATTGGGTYTVTSGIVKSLEFETYATCNKRPLTDTEQNCYVRIGRIGGSWNAWLHVCSPITGPGTIDHQGTP